MRYVLVVVCVLSVPAWANDAALLRCRAITDPMQRLACYEAIPVGNPVAGVSAAAPPSKEPGKSRAVPTASPPSPASNAVAGFGLPERPPEITRIESAIQGKLQGWEPNTRIRLANGQVWQVVDDSSAYCHCDNRKAAVRRGALGAFYLEVDGTNRSPRVKRVE